MVIIDIETSGIDPLRASILSLGAVDFADPANRFYMECRMDEGSEATEEAFRINGFTRDSANDPAKPSAKELLVAFFAWLDPIADKTAAGQNVHFDRDFINAACAKHGIARAIDKRMVDMHGVAYAHVLARGETPATKGGWSGMNTDSILTYVGLEERPGAHNGLTDALLEAEAFSRLILGKNLLPEYSRFPLPGHLER